MIKYISDIINRITSIDKLEIANVLLEGKNNSLSQNDFMFKAIKEGVMLP